VWHHCSCRDLLIAPLLNSYCFSCLPCHNMLKDFVKVVIKLCSLYMMICSIIILHTIWINWIFLRKIANTRYGILWFVDWQDFIMNYLLLNSIPNIQLSSIFKRINSNWVSHISYRYPLTSVLSTFWRVVA
jgi:hypothetical protein